MQQLAVANVAVKFNRSAQAKGVRLRPYPSAIVSLADDRKFQSRIAANDFRPDFQELVVTFIALLALHASDDQSVIAGGATGTGEATGSRGVTGRSGDVLDRERADMDWDLRPRWITDAEPVCRKLRIGED